MSLLSSLRVIEVSGSGAAAWAAKHFADWGAEVTILEPAGGTPLRHQPPIYEKDGVEKSATWAWLSRGKVAVRGHLASDEALNACRDADVVLAEAELCQNVLGVPATELRAALQGHSTCVLISPFAIDGPYADYQATELGVSAMGGWMSQLGDPRREPVRPGFAPLPRIAGIFAFVSALIALRHMRQGGTPEFVELSLQAVAASICTPGWLTKSLIGALSERIGDLWPLGVMKCADGYVGVPPLTATHWEQLCYMMGIADVLDLPEGRSPEYRRRHGRELYERVRPWLEARTRKQVFEEAQAWRLPSAQVQTTADRLECPQLDARGFWQETTIGGTPVKTPRVPYAIEGVEPTARSELREIDALPAARTREVRNADVAPGLPFAGLRVLDLTQFWSGPYAMMLLGALGADVIKIESVQRLDPYRYTLAQPDRDRWYECGSVWNDANCDKRSLTLDLASLDGKIIFERLVPHADIVISNFSNRVMPNLGLTNERLLQLNPRLIAITMPGYGTGGPWEEYVGYAIAFEQLITASMTGYADGPPLYAGGFCDPLVGMHTVAAIELALQQRERTGRGTSVEIAQCETLDSLLAPEAIAVQFGAPVPGRRGNKHEWMAPHDAYRVAGKDAWLTLAVSSDEEFAALARVLGRPDLGQDARFAAVAARKENELALDEVITSAVANRDALELEQALQSAGVKACRVIKSYDLADDRGLEHIGFFQQLTREASGTHLFKTWPFRFDDIEASHKRPAPLLGAHNDDVLRGILGLSDAEIGRLEREQVIGREPLGLAKQNY
jgi:crotonobetainyl-CoA:carnitine CoA-transferase CaiB-like acyl-CoA transferase